MSSADMAPGVAPECPRHPGVVSYVRCQRCERHACPSCQTPAPVGVICVDCVREANRNARPMRSSLGFTMARGRPFVTLTLIALNVAVYFLAPMLLGNTWYVHLGMWPDVAVDWYRWITAGFVHFGLLHLGINMFVLWQFGSQLEQVMGRGRYAALYFLSLLGSSLAVYLFGSFPSVHGGSSGAIFGLVAAFVIALKRLNLDWRSQAMFAGAWLVMGFFVSNISWEGHLGGAVVGATVMALMLRSVERRGERQGVRG